MATKSPISLNAWAESKFRIKIRNRHQISRQKIYIHSRFKGVCKSFHGNWGSTPTQSWIWLRSWQEHIIPIINYMPFDEEFYIDFEFLFKILIPPTHFEISLIFKFCVGGLKNFLSHQIRNFILSQNICIFCMFYTCKNRFWNRVRNFKRRPSYP